MAPDGGGRPRARSLLRWSLWAHSMRSSPPLRAVFLLGLAVLLVSAGGTALIITELRSREIKEAGRELSNLNTALSEEASRAVQGVDLILGNLVDGFRQEGVETSDDLVRLQFGYKTHELLRARVSGLPQLDAVTLIAADGQLVNYSRGFPIPSVNVSDRDYFQFLRDTKTEAPFVSEPLQNRSTGTWTVYIARRLSGQDGSFVGLVLGAIDLKYFENFYRSLQLGGSAVSLWRQDGTLLARYPPVERVGRKYATPAFPAEGGATPLYEGASVIDGQGRVIARRAVPGFPLVVVVSRTLDSVLADWRRQAGLVGTLGALVCAAIVTVMAALARQFLVYEELAEAVRDREAAIAARESAEAQLRQSQKLETMGQLTSGVAHDFNNLLTIVLGNLDILAKRLSGADASTTRYLSGAQGGAERAAGLARRLLAFARREKLEQCRIDVSELVRGMEDLLRQTLGKNVGLELQLAPDLLPVVTDPGQLEGALLNLVVNARDAMPDGGQVTVRTRPVDDGDQAAIELSVADTGIGMTPEVAQRAFEPFFTTKGPGVGTGLGLAQVYGFAKQSGGDVAVWSEPGQGTRITLRLPCSPSPADEPREVVAEAYAPASSPLRPEVAVRRN